jgi:hypothetical protein
MLANGFNIAITTLSPHIPADIAISACYAGKTRTNSQLLIPHYSSQIMSLAILIPTVLYMRTHSLLQSIANLKWLRWLGGAPIISSPSFTSPSTVELRIRNPKEDVPTHGGLMLKPQPWGHTCFVMFGLIASVDDQGAWDWIRRRLADARDASRKKRKTDERTRAH